MSHRWEAVSPLGPKGLANEQIWYLATFTDLEGRYFLDISAAGNKMPPIFRRAAGPDFSSDLQDATSILDHLFPIEHRLRLGSSNTFFCGWSLRVAAHLIVPVGCVSPTLKGQKKENSTPYFAVCNSCSCFSRLFFSGPSTILSRSSTGADRNGQHGRAHSRRWHRTRCCSIPHSPRSLQALGKATKHQQLTPNT